MAAITTFPPLTSLSSKTTNLTALEGCLVLDNFSSGLVPWNNPHNLISRETEKAVDTVVGALCLPVLFAISVPCNIISMAVFWTQGLRERINLCLFYLSLVDCLHMINNIIFNIDKIGVPFSLSAELGAVAQFIGDHSLVGFMRGFNWLSGFVSMVIASERCLCVVSPLRAQTLLTTKTTAWILVAATVLILAGSLVIGVRWTLICVFDLLTSRTSRIIFTSPFYRQHKAQMDVLTFIMTTAQLFLYVIVVAVTTIVTSVKLRKMVAWRREQTSSSSAWSQREVALTRMLIAVSILYIVCSVPTIVSGLGVIFMPGVGFSGRYYNLTQLVVSLMELASFINATLNFFVYCFLGSRFKETLRSLFCCCCKAMKSQSNHRSG